MIDTTDTSNDSLDRAAALLVSPDGKSLLIGHAPNRKSGDNQWDIVGKGHIEKGDNAKNTCVREVEEEASLKINKDSLVYLGSAKYQKGKLHIYIYTLSEMPENIKCNSCFDWYGKSVPEFEEYKWVTFQEAKKYLYKGLVKVLDELGVFSENN